MVDAFVAALEQRPEGLDAVDVGVAADVLAARVVRGGVMLEPQYTMLESLYTSASPSTRSAMNASAVSRVTDWTGAATILRVSRFRTPMTGVLSWVHPRSSVFARLFRWRFLFAPPK